MSAKTRIKRPTTATPRKVGANRYLHVSARIGEELDKDGKPTGKRFVGPGTTYRRPS